MMLRRRVDLRHRDFPLRAPENFDKFLGKSENQNKKRKNLRKAKFGAVCFGFERSVGGSIPPLGTKCKNAIDTKSPAREGQIAFWHQHKSAKIPDRKSFIFLFGKFGKDWIQFGQVAERPNATDCKSVDYVFDGSNPSLPTKTFKCSIFVNQCWRGSMVEQLTCNQQVEGSIPFASSIEIGVSRFFYCTSQR